MPVRECAKRFQGVGELHKKILKIKCTKIHRDVLAKISYQKILKNGSVKKCLFSNKMIRDWNARNQFLPTITRTFVALKSVSA